MKQRRRCLSLFVLCMSIDVTFCDARWRPATNDLPDPPDSSSRPTADRQSQETILQAIIDGTMTEPKNDVTRSEENRLESVPPEFFKLLFRNVDVYPSPIPATKRKRTCRFNLGGHCSTEKAISMADRWHFLSSARSPGRRRRR